MIMAQVIKITKYKNQDIIKEIYNDIIFIVKLFIIEKIFKRTLNYDLKDNSKSIYMNLFYNGMVVLIRAIILQNKIC